jgi:predicted RNA binding protein YcfA (HicA-like mRNA interferase family)
MGSYQDSVGRERLIYDGHSGGHVVGFDLQRSEQYPLRMKVNEILAQLLGDGWYLVATRGSHRQFKHPEKPGRVTVAGKPSDDLAPGTLNSILKQARLK